MEVTIARWVESRVQRQSTNSRLGATRMRADCLRSGQIGMGFWEATYLFIENSISYVLVLEQWLSSLPLFATFLQPYGLLAKAGQTRRPEGE